MTTDALRRKRAKLAGQIDLLDELLAEMEMDADDVPPRPPEFARPLPPVSPAKAPPVEDTETPAPKAARPGTGANAGRKDKTPPEPLLAALRGGPLAMKDLEARLGVTQPPIRRILDEHPEWFRKAEPGNRLSPWTLTEAGERAADAAR